LLSKTRTYTYADHLRSQIFIFRTALVEKKRTTGRRGTTRDSYNAPFAENVTVNSVLVGASRWDAMAMAATIANQLQMARRDAVVDWVVEPALAEIVA
jgi:hypothetical protein